MKDSKLFIAGIVAFALALGVILGNFCSKNSACCCQKADMSQCMRHDMTPPPPPGPHGDFHKNHRPPGDFHKGPKHKGHMNPEVIDSLLQVTPEQKAALWHLLKELKRAYPHAQIVGHRDFPHVTKLCPLFDTRQEYASLQNHD